MNYFPRAATKSVAIYHLPTTGGQKQPYPGTADLTVTGAFLPMDRYMHALEGGNFTNPMDLFLDPTTDVRIGDKVVVDGVDYFVRRLWVANFGTIRHQRVSLSTQL